MNCSDVREAISATLDGEPPGSPVSDLEDHLEACAACRAWRERAHELTRRVRLQPVGLAPPPQLMTALTGAPRTPWWQRRSLPRLRILLLLVAAAQLAISLPILIFGHDHSAPLHVAHEMGSFDVALGIAFLVAAWRPQRAMGMLALVGAAAALLVVTAAVDLATGRTGLTDEAPHLLVVVGWLLLRCLAAVAPPVSDRPRSPVAWGHLIRGSLTRRVDPAGAAAWSPLAGPLGGEAGGAALSSQGQAGKRVAG